jgi:uncharacterized protein YndB with AHSA1/START domain
LAVCEIDLRAGGALRFVWRHRDGRDMGMSGVYREIAPYERLVFTELFDEDWTGGEALVTMVFAEHAGKTTLTQTALLLARRPRRRPQHPHGARLGCELRPACGAVGVGRSSWRLTSGTALYSGLCRVSSG